MGAKRKFTSYTLGTAFSPERGSLRKALMEQGLTSVVFWNRLTKSLCRARISGRNFTSLSSVS